MDINKHLPYPVGPVAPGKAGQSPAQPRVQSQVPFSQVWQDTLQKQEPVRFSAHALQRLQTRKIELGSQDMQKINDAVAAADKKGARSSLLLYQDLAFVASVKNKTIITAMGGDDLREHVFTNIDSAVIIK